MITMLALFVSLASAQTPPADVAPATPGDLVSSASTGTTLWATAGGTLRQLPEDSSAAVGDLASGDKLQLVLADGEWSRVMKGTTVGWVSASAVSAVAPAKEGAFDLSGLGLGTLPPLGGATPLTAPPKTGQ
jgi:hypothetical protein